MIEICVYCYEPRNDKNGCCGENHWDEVIDDEVMIPKTYDAPMSQTDEHLLKQQREEEHKSHDY
jgi:hypothetical protein